MVVASEGKPERESEGRLVVDVGETGRQKARAKGRKRDAWTRKRKWRWRRIILIPS